MLNTPNRCLPSGSSSRPDDQADILNRISHFAGIPGLWSLSGGDARLVAPDDGRHDRVLRGLEAAGIPATRGRVDLLWEKSSLPSVTIAAEDMRLVTKAKGDTAIAAMGASDDTRGPSAGTLGRLLAVVIPRRSNGQRAASCDHD